MSAWPSNRLMDLLNIEVPILLAPMAGCSGVALAVAVANAGGLGAYPCAYVKTEKIEKEVGDIQASTNRPLNLNFFCHDEPVFNGARQDEWRAALEPYYAEYEAEFPVPLTAASETSFNEDLCALVEKLRPNVVSFHFGLPRADLLQRVKEIGCTILCSATTVDEARHLEDQGVDAIIAQGVEAGGHRGMFLSSDIASQVGTMALVPQIVDAVGVPIIAAGGIGDGRGIAAAFALGASGVQLGTAFLRCPEALTSAVHRSALAKSSANGSVLTNVFSGKPARSIANRLVREQGPISRTTPDFPLATRELGPLRAASQGKGDDGFTSLWSGQAAALAGDKPAAEVIRQLSDDALAILSRLGNIS